MRVDGHANVWAIGDAAAVPDPAHKDQPSPPTAQHALRQGRRVARQRRRGARATAAARPFRYRTLGVFVDMGRKRRWRARWGSSGAASRPGSSPARTTSRSCPANARRTRLLVDWTVGLLFGRDSAELGQLGHPPVLGRDELREQSEGGTGADGTAEPAAATPAIPAP